ncbi:MAG: hypothetical protein J6X16_01050 [Bacteroidales bacterium]|nr:hypothetical protein [Bacteroidales bacterium]
MNKLFKIVITGLCLLFGFFITGNAQKIIGTGSDTVYLLSVFQNSGEKENIDENYYCAVFLDKKSDMKNLVPLKTEDYMRVRYDTTDVAVGEYSFIKPNDSLERRIAEDLANHFFSNACIGAGISFTRAGMECLKTQGVTDPYYLFIKDTLLKSDMRSFPLYSDILLGEIVGPLESGGLIICDSPPCDPWEFNYNRRGTYCRLFKLYIEYLLIDDEDGNVLSKSYSFTINTDPFLPESIRNLKILVGDISGDGAFSCSLRVVFKGDKLLTALPYRVIKLTK